MTGGSLFGGDGAAIARPEDVIPFLGKASHWREGRSAYETAYSWFDHAGRLPASIAGVLSTCVDFSGARLVQATFEKQTALDNLGRPSQTDVLALIATPSRKVVVAVEAKVDETFGPTVAEWRAADTPGKASRLAGLVARLSLAPESVPPLRYQLLHRSVAALIEARAAGASDAVLVVQSFSEPEARAGFDDFRAFTIAMGAPVDAPGMLSDPIERDHVRLRFGWAQDTIRARRPGP